MSSWITAYVDETGTNELDSTKPGVSNLFICVAVLVDESGKSVCEEELQNLAKDLCGGAEIASSSLGSNHPRRTKFLERIALLPFGYFALIINKDLIPRDSGLQYKKSFYKFINHLLYRRLLKSGSNLRIIADQIGGKDFMDSFLPYFESKGIPSLFQEFDHEFADSGKNRLVQLADLIAGSLSYCFDPLKKGEHSRVFRELLRPRESGIRCWPWEEAPLTSKNETQLPIDVVLRTRMEARVTAFLREYENTEDNDRGLQYSTLRRILFARQFEERDKQALVSDKLMEKLFEEGFESMSKQAFQSRVIGKIRDEGIILAGASDGYRLALSVNDIREYLDHDKNIIEPMLARVVKARESVLIDTGQALDVLADAEYDILQKVTESFNEAQVGISAARSFPHSGK
ncbi:MAG: uncharacterized protein JWM68_51 [Verrucomicrobiales bacterium]|nr:uncharacterized protein [Verrucomicrobiales bacterium]